MTNVSFLSISKKEVVPIQKQRTCVVIPIVVKFRF